MSTETFNTNYSTIGGKIKARRTSLGLSMERLANAANITIADLELYESGKKLPQPNVMVAIAKAANVRASYFFLDFIGSLGEIGHFAEDGQAVEDGSEVVLLVKYFVMIADAKKRMEILQLVKMAADARIIGIPIECDFDCDGE